MFRIGKLFDSIITRATASSTSSNFGLLLCFFFLLGIVECAFFRGISDNRTNMIRRPPLLRGGFSDRVLNVMITMNPKIIAFSSPVLGDMKLDDSQISYVSTYKSFKNNKRVLTSSLNIFMWHIETRTTNCQLPISIQLESNCCSRAH